MAQGLHVPHGYTIEIVRKSHVNGIQFWMGINMYSGTNKQREQYCTYN